jgi:hypothetical protein
VSGLEDQGVSTTSTSRQEDKSTAMSEKPISLLRQRMTEDTPAAGCFYPEQTMIIQPVPLMTIECVRSARSQQLLNSARYIHQEFA